MFIENQLEMYLNVNSYIQHKIMPTVLTENGSNSKIYLGLMIAGCKCRMVHNVQFPVSTSGLLQQPESAESKY